jgi:hypothetical protein
MFFNSVRLAFLGVFNSINLTRKSSQASFFILLVGFPVLMALTIYLSGMYLGFDVDFNSKYSYMLFGFFGVMNVTLWVKVHYIRAGKHTMAKVFSSIPDALCFALLVYLCIEVVKV